VERSRLDIYREILEGFGPMTFDRDLVDPDFVLVQHGGNMDGTYRGTEGLDSYAAQFAEAWDQSEVVVEEMLERGDRVAALVVLKVRGGLSGIEVEIRGGAIAHFAPDGKVARLDGFTDRDEFLALIR
jgi:ketosteroid isomerase-like protein